MARPRQYNRDAMMARISQLILAGIASTKACKILGVPPSTAYSWPGITECIRIARLRTIDNMSACPRCGYERRSPDSLDARG